MAEFQPGASYRVNGRGDLGFDGDVKHLIGKVVEFVRITKGGKAEVRYEGKLHYVTQRNLEPTDLQPLPTHFIDPCKWHITEELVEEAQYGVEFNSMSYADLPPGDPLRGLAEDATPEEQAAAAQAIEKLTGVKCNGNEDH